MMMRMMVLVVRLVVSTRVSSVLTNAEVIPGPQWTTAFGSIYIRTANLLWAPTDCQVVVIQHTHYDADCN